VIVAAFRAEQAAVVAAARAGRDPTVAVKVKRWERVLEGIWLDTGERVYPATVTTLTAAKQSQRLIALAQEIVRGKRPASRVAKFIEEAAAGITRSTRRRIHTVLGEAATPSEVRQVTQGLARLYRTDFVGDRASRIALDNVLRASATFENAAAMQVAASTGRNYTKHWVNQGDDRVRAAHQGVTPVAINEDFKIDGETLRYPRDPAGPGHLTYGCRCWVEHRRKAKG
jgi:uncharacterized protein with gpF-like domain